MPSGGARGATGTRHLGETSAQRAGAAETGARFHQQGAGCRGIGAMLAACPGTALAAFGRARPGAQAAIIRQRPFAMAGWQQEQPDRVRAPWDGAAR
jgi:hypothetical protein